MREKGIQINKFISSSGYCSRREADKYIEQGRVTINNEVALPVSRVQTGDLVEVDGELIKESNKKHLYLAFNKPRGVTTTTDPKDRSNIIYFINYPKRIFPVGRLDKDSEGLILLTNDGDIVNKILRAGNEHEKEYLVTADKALSAQFVKEMAGGLPILGVTTDPCKVWQTGQRNFRIILKQGLNRQIRRMCEYLGYKVVSLKRVRIMNINLGNLPSGKWRNLSPEESRTLFNMLKQSIKTEEASGKKNSKRK